MATLKFLFDDQVIIRDKGFYEGSTASVLAVYTPDGEEAVYRTSLGLFPESLLEIQQHAPKY